MSRSYPVAAAPLDRARRIAAAVPAWAWLTAMIAASVVLRSIVARQSPAPWIFDDELIYARLADSLASTGSFSIRGLHGLLGYGAGYPILISPAYLLFADGERAYDAVKTLNALFMSLAAIPVYLIARTVLGRWQSLAAAAFALAIPSLAYTSVVMTENAFYPAFLVCVLAFVRVLGRPTLGRQALALALICPAYVIRAQAILLVPAFVTTLAAFALLEARASEDGLRPRSLLRQLDAFRATWIGLALGAVGVVALQAARGRDVATLLGAYRDVTGWSYSASDVAKWVVYHLAELDLYLGILPFAALIVVCATACGRLGVSREERAFAAVSVPLVLWLALSASLLSSQLESLDGIGRVEERNVFYVAPLFLIALLVWVDRGVGRRRPLAVAAALVAGLLPVVIPYAKLVNLGALSDTLAFIPLARSVSGGDFDAGSIRTIVLVGAIEAAVIFVLLPRRLAVLAPILVLTFFVVWQTSLNRQIRETSSFIGRTSITVAPTWIDDAVGRDARVAALWRGGVNPLALQESEFFNRSLDRVYQVGTPPPLGQQLPETPSAYDPVTGVLLDGSGSPVTSPYVVAGPSTLIRGARLAEDPGTGLALYRVRGPIRARELVSGLYGDGWSGSTVTYTRYGCRPGVLQTVVTRYPGLLLQPQRLVARSGGRTVAELTMPVYVGNDRLSVPLRPQRDGRCEVTFQISPTAVPAAVLGGLDTRELGLHFDQLSYSRLGRRAGRP